MLNKIIQYSLHNRLVVMIASIALLLWGSYTAHKMEVDVFPDLNAPTVVVMTEAQGMAPEEVERIRQTLLREDMFLPGLSNQDPEDLARDIREMGRREASEYMVDTFCLPCTPEQVMEGVNALVTGEYRDRVPMKTGADTLLERLGALGVPCGIATASEAFQARDAMVRLGLWKHFLFAFSSLQYGPKTGPDLYRAAARSLGSAPERTVVFEDALHAARSAKRAGFLVAGVYDPSAEEDQEALRCLCDWYLPRLDSPDFLAALERG